MICPPISQRSSLESMMTSNGFKNSELRTRKETFLVFLAFCSPADNILQPVSAVLYYNWWPHNENESSEPFAIAYLVLLLLEHSGGNHETFRRSVVCRYLQPFIFHSLHAYNPEARMPGWKKKKKHIHKDKLAKIHHEQNRSHTFRKLKIFGRTSHSIFHLEILCQVATCSYLYGSAEAHWFYWWLVEVLQVWQFGHGDFLVAGTSSDLEHIYCSRGVRGKKFHPP